MDHNRSADLTGLDAAVYLRKSRMEEGLATDEVLAKHQKTRYRPRHPHPGRVPRGGQRRVTLCPPPDAPAPPGRGGRTL